MPSIAGCEEIDSYRFYRRRHPLFHGYVLPFIPAYAALLYQLREVLPLALRGEGEEGEGSLVALLFSSNLELPLALLLFTFLIHILLSLSCVWSVHVRCLLTCSHAPLPSATLVKVVPTTNNGSTELVPLRRKDAQVWFEFQKIRYHYDPLTSSFSPPSLNEQRPLGAYLLASGLSGKEAAGREEQFGRCALGIDLPRFSELFLERATAPFFVFQLLCVLLWCLDEYWMYALFTLLMLATLECMVVFQQKRNLSAVREMVREPQRLLVYRDQKWEPLPSDRLVPGDVISLHVSRHEVECPCDALLLFGSLVVDEAMLTGESVPQHKEPVSDRDRTDVFSFERDDKLHVVFSGTKVLQTEPPPRGAAPLKPPNAGALAYVLRTGFSTSQGRLVRTILYGVKRVTDNNVESLLFLLFLMHFALAAAGYVWVYGTADPGRSRYKLFLQCAFIVTTVVPPELPIILSLAVNNSLITLLRSRIFCTEPFRLPNAGKLTFCCFDKTGTLTSSAINFLGVTTSPQGSLSSELGPLPSASSQTQLVVGFCHSLVSIRGGDMVGDPLEVAAFTAAGWSLGRENRPQLPKSLRVSGAYQPARKFHFNSTLKRMSVVCVSGKGRALVLTKGAPEAVRGLLAEIPEGFDRVHQELVCLGTRVLALAYKELPSNLKMFSSLPRQEAESGLHFCGFICFSSPIKPDSRRSLLALSRSSHQLVMITGDNPYTACHVGDELGMSRMDRTLILSRRGEEWAWVSPDRSVSLTADTLGELGVLGGRCDLCVTGEGMSHCSNLYSSDRWIENVRIFARMSPKHKEQVITSLNRRHYTLMCGDGTNDVGALKHAHVGVSLLSRPPTHDPAPPSLLQLARAGRDKRREELMRQADMGDAPPPVKLGDASIASPFTSRSDSISAVCSIVRYGRCTLVTILQMYKIIAVSALISAYSQSALYLDGVKFSDLQAMLQGMVIAVSFMIFSRIRPLEELSRTRPIPNVFNLYTLSTVFLQSTVHLLSIVALVREAKLLMPDGPVDLDATFEASILNTAVFLISLCMQLNTCTINYSGRPFIPSLYENKILLGLLSLGYASLFSLSLGVPAGFCEMMEILILPEQFRMFLLQVIAVDIVASWILDYAFLILYRKFWLKS